METVYQVMGLVLAGLLIFWMYRVIKGRPELFSKDKINKSLGTMGVLGIILIVFVAFLVLMTRYT